MVNFVPTTEEGLGLDFNWITPPPSPPLSDAELAAYAVSEQLDPVSRTLFLLEENVSENTLRRVLPQLHVLDASDGDITVVISSNGGCGVNGMALYGAMKRVRNKLITFGIGRVYSMGAILFQAGDERLLDPGCRVMFHEGSSGAEGSRREFRAWVKESNEQLKYIIAEVRKRSGLSKEEVAELFGDESYMSAQEAVRRGLADRIVRR